MTTAKSGTTKITFSDAAFLRSVDLVSDGAASGFLATVRPSNVKIIDTARSRWPVRTGTSRDAFEILEEVTETKVKASIHNPATLGRWGLYAYKVKYSSWTKVDIQAYIEAGAAKGKTPEAQAAIRKTVSKKTFRTHGHGAPDEASQGKNVWSLLVRNPAKAALTPLLPLLQANLSKLAQVK